MFILNPKSFGLAGGIVWGLFILLATWMSALTGYATVFLSVLTDLYPGYFIGLWGGVIGLVYGFLHVFVVLYALAWIYNFFEH